MAKKKKKEKNKEEELQPTHEYPTEQARSFLETLSAKCNAYQKPQKPKRPTLREFLAQRDVYEAIKGMLEHEKPWSVIAEAVNETFGTTLKASTISSAFCLVAKEKGEPRSVYQQQKYEELRRKKAEAKKASASTLSTPSTPSTSSASSTTLGASSTSSTTLGGAPLYQSQSKK